MDQKAYQFSDELIGQIAKLLQVAILSGTDIIDNLRTLYVTEGEEGKLVLLEAYKRVFEGQLDRLLEDAEKLQTLSSGDEGETEFAGEHSTDEDAN